MTDFSVLIGRTIGHCFIPADAKAITFVCADGARASFGAVNVCALVGPGSGTVSAIEESAMGPQSLKIVMLHTDRGDIVFAYSGAEMARLPE